MKKKQMADLEKKYNNKLTKKVNGKPLKTTITMGDLAAEKKDDDLDIKIKIAPNNAEGSLAVQIFARLRQEDVQKMLDKEVEDQGISDSLPTWAAVFAAAGKKIKGEKGKKKGKQLKFRDAVKEKNVFISTIEQTLLLTYNRVARKYLESNNKSEAEVLMEITRVANEVADSVWDKELIYISPTDIIRNLPAETFVRKNPKLADLGSGIGKVKHSEMIENSDGLLHKKLR